ncbi:MAG: hypothetical protein R2799_10015 [Crocinitomicaceae bacterium]
MSKKVRYIFTFGLTGLIFVFLWIYSQQKNKITKLESEVKSKENQIQHLEDEYQACKGAIYHKNKLLEMEKRKVNQLHEVSKDSIEY